AMAEVEEKLPGMIGHMEPDAPGMHTTDTVDFEVVLSGEVWLELDDGAEVHLKPGDTVVQNGTRHAWRNKGSEPATLVAFINGAVAVGGAVADMAHADWVWTLGVDLWGPIHGVEAFLPRMRSAGAGGHLLFTASFAGLVPNVGLGPYCVAKYGVVAMAE